MSSGRFTTTLIVLRTLPASSPFRFDREVDPSFTPSSLPFEPEVRSKFDVSGFWELPRHLGWCVALSAEPVQLRTSSIQHLEHSHFAEKSPFATLMQTTGLSSLFADAREESLAARIWEKAPGRVLPLAQNRRLALS